MNIDAKRGRGNGLSIAIIGATGMVGKMLMQILEERNVPVAALHLFAAPQDAGKKMPFRFSKPDGSHDPTDPRLLNLIYKPDGRHDLTDIRELTVEALTETSFDRGIDIALFAVSNEISQKYAPIVIEKGCIMIDNSSAWRLDPTVPLVVPEVNSADIATHRGIIANPNCCACPTVVALKPLHDAFGLRRVVISTYQSVSGAGVVGLDDLTATMKGEAPKHFPYPIAHNLIPHIDEFEENGYTGEEMKLMDEVRKILHLPNLPITATTVRVPVYTGHSLSINAELEKPFEMEKIRQLLTSSPGITIADNPAGKIYPMPLTAAGTDLVHIGRIRRDFSCENGLNLWVVADNVRKGAATNAIQILEELL